MGYLMYVEHSWVVKALMSALKVENRNFFVWLKWVIMYVRWWRHFFVFFYFSFRFLWYASFIIAKVLFLNMPNAKKSSLIKKVDQNQPLFLGLGSTLFRNFNLFYFFLGFALRVTLWWNPFFKTYSLSKDSQKSPSTIRKTTLEFVLEIEILLLILIWY